MTERIRTQRELLGYTREKLSEKLNVSAKFCSDIELGVKGRIYPDIDEAVGAAVPEYRLHPVRNRIR